ncbi:MAG TPA: sodium:calcium symporter, partial [bacterium]
MAKMAQNERENWGSKIGVILAVAGSAVGLGNFLRFPVQAASHGGGAFMIPYFLAFLLMGIPIAWVEWTMGRYGGRHGHGTGPGVYHVITGGRRWAKYLGATAVLGPLGIFFYYCYVEGWTLSYAIFSLTGEYRKVADPSHMNSFLSGFQGVESNQYFNGPWVAYAAFALTFAANFYFIYRGVVHGIERLNKVALPLMGLIGLV